jgi:hypothetical protein
MAIKHMNMNHPTMQSSTVSLHSKTSTNKLGEAAEAVDEKVMAFHATKPGGPMQRFHKDSPAPGAQAHRDATAAAVKGLRAAGKIKSKELSQGGTDEITTPKGGRVWAKNVKEAVEDAVDATMIHHNALEIPESINEADRNYDAHFRAMMKKHGINHPGEFKSDEEKKAFFNKVDASFKAKNEDVFYEAWMSSAIQDVMNAHKKAGNKISDEKTATKEGKPHHSFVVTTPEGKRTRHIYHGSNKKLETMSPAARSKEAKEVGDDEDDK